MQIGKAVITAAAPYQRTLPLHTLIDHDGQEKTVLQIIVDDVRAAGIEEITIVVHPGDEDAYAKAVDAGRGVRFLLQDEPRGYAHAVWSARDFVGHDAFLHVVGDHIYVPSPDQHCAARDVVELAQKEDCSVSAVQPTREANIGMYGIVGGTPFSSYSDVYRIEEVIEKPTPTEAEQRLTVSGLRAGHYLGFFGIHALTPAVLDICGRLLASEGRPSLSEALSELSRQEHYLGIISPAQRYNLGVRYGFFSAQLALALRGRDAPAVLARIIELLGSRHTERGTAV